MYDRIHRLDVLTVAWWLVWKNDGKPGIDGMSSRDSNDGPGAGNFLANFQEELRSKRYRPQAVKRVMIPKANGGERPLGIPTGKDRIVQMATLLVLEPILEADFHGVLMGPDRENRPTRRWTRSAPTCKPACGRSTTRT